MQYTTKSKIYQLEILHYILSFMIIGKIPWIALFNTYSWKFITINNKISIDLVSNITEKYLKCEI